MDYKRGNTLKKLQGMKANDKKKASDRRPCIRDLP